MAYYDFKKKPALTTKEEEKDVLYPGIVYSGKITSERLIRELSQHSPFKEGEVEGVLKDLFNLTTRFLGEGYQVELGEFGVFAGKITSRKVENPEDIRSVSISFNGVNFRPSARFKGEITGDLKRSKYNKFRHSDFAASQKKREKTVLDYIDEKGFITRSIYSRLTHRLKDTALRDLHDFEIRGIIERVGRGNQMYFIRAKKVETDAIE